MSFPCFEYSFIIKGEIRYVYRQIIKCHKSIYEILKKQTKQKGQYPSNCSVTASRRYCPYNEVQANVIDKMLEQTKEDKPSQRTASFSHSQVQLAMLMTTCFLCAKIRHYQQTDKPPYGHATTVREVLSTRRENSDTADLTNKLVNASQCQSKQKNRFSFRSMSRLH